MWHVTTKVLTVWVECHVIAIDHLLIYSAMQQYHDSLWVIFVQISQSESVFKASVLSLSIKQRKYPLTHWGQVMHISFGKLTITGSDNGLSSDRHQAIIWCNAGILLIGPLGTNFSEILIEIDTFWFKKMHLKIFFWKMAVILSQPQCVITLQPEQNGWKFCRLHIQKYFYEWKLMKFDKKNFSFK